MQNIKWYTISEYVDLHTGEILTKEVAKKYYFIKEKIIKTETKIYYGSEYRIKHITNICTNDGKQRELF